MIRYVNQRMRITETKRNRDNGKIPRPFPISSILFAMRFQVPSSLSQELELRATCKKMKEVMCAFAKEF